MQLEEYSNLIRFRYESNVGVSLEEVKYTVTLVASLARDVHNTEVYAVSIHMKNRIYETRYVAEGGRTFLYTTTFEDLVGYDKIPSIPIREVIL